MGVHAVGTHLIGGPLQHGRLVSLPFRDGVKDRYGRCSMVGACTHMCPCAHAHAAACMLAHACCAALRNGRLLIILPHASHAEAAFSPLTPASPGSRLRPAGQRSPDPDHVLRVARACASVQAELQTRSIMAMQQSEGGVERKGCPICGLQWEPRGGHRGLCRAGRMYNI